MKFRNKTISLTVLLLINIVRVICQSSEENEEEEVEVEPNEEMMKKVELCEDELNLEFMNDHPLDDFVHGFLNIKFDRVLWDAKTDINEHIYCGYGVLKKSAAAYYKELFDIVLEMGIPEFPSSEDFCRTNHEDDEEYCTSVLKNIGCGVHVDKSACFKKMYFNWKKTNPDYFPLRGTRHLSDAELREAIVKGVSSFGDLTDEQLFQMLTYGDGIIDSLNDDNLLREIGIEPQNRKKKSPFGSGRRGRRGYGNEDAEGSMQHARDLFNQEKYEENVADARIIKYGVSSASYATLCEEYKRRKLFPKYFDNLYATEISVQLKQSSWDTSNFISRKDFCVNYVIGQQ